MNIYNGFPQFDTQSVVVVGSFDGVHSGHRRLIASVNDKADQLALRPIVLTFDPHPRQVLRGENRLLSTIDERIELFRQAGVRNLIIVNFTKEFASIDADDFTRNFLKEKLQAQLVFTGEGHTFGKNRTGDDEVLHRNGIVTCHIPRYQEISSTRVRAAVEAGEMEEATRLLGDHYLVLTPIVENTKLLPLSGRFCCEVDGVLTELSVEQIRCFFRKSTIRIKNRL